MLPWLWMYPCLWPADEYAIHINICAFGSRVHLEQPLNEPSVTTKEFVNGFIVTVLWSHTGNHCKDGTHIKQIMESWKPPLLSHDIALFPRAHVFRGTGQCHTDVTRQRWAYFFPWMKRLHAMPVSMAQPRFSMAKSSNMTQQEQNHPRQCNARKWLTIPIFVCIIHAPAA